MKRRQDVKLTAKKIFSKVNLYKESKCVIIIIRNNIQTYIYVFQYIYSDNNELELNHKRTAKINHNIGNFKKILNNVFIKEKIKFEIIN